MRSLCIALAALPLVLAIPTLNPRGDNAIPGKYIVILKGGARVEEVKGAIAGGAIASVDLDHSYAIGSFTGFAASLSTSQVTALQSDPKVAYVEQDGRAHTMQEEDDDGGNANAITQSNAAWGLGRISHRTKGSTDYIYDSSAGSGTCAYIIDTGIYAEHAEFEGRATFVKNVATGSTATTDDNGHGTHCAGTIGSKTFGVAKKTRLYGIKVLDADGSGAWSDIVAGIQLAVSDSQARSCPAGVVVNMSLGGDKQQSVNDAVAAAVDAGLFFAVAAGNEGMDFKTTSPASEPKAFAVGASDVNDALASFSNYGKTLGVIAPGVDVNSTWNSQDQTNIISGTSMATPHVVGLSAYLLGLTPGLTPAQVKSKIQSLATTNAIALTSAAKGTPNKLAFNGISA